jgi:hypothetical protein
MGILVEPKQARRQLVERILESHYFAQAPSLRRILQYLCERAGETGPGMLKEHEIAVKALGRAESFDPKTDPIVRVSIAAIRQRLQAYFDSEGRAEPVRLDIPKGLYRAVFTAQSSGETPATEDGEGRITARRRFWEPYLSGQVKNLLLYTDVLFFRDDAGNYLRNIFVNSLSGGLEEIRKRLPLEPSYPLKPSFHFQSAGEVNAMLSLIRLFAQLKTPLEVRNSRFTSWNELRSSNLILLGSSRTSSFVDSLQGGNDFVITADSIRNLQPREGEEPNYTGRRYMEGSLEKVIEPALVTRRPGLTPGTTVTMISANHGRAIEGAGHFLALEDDLAEVLQSCGMEMGGALPEHFQLLLDVHLVDFDEEVIDVEHVSHRVAASGRSRPRSNGGT